MYVCKSLEKNKHELLQSGKKALQCEDCRPNCLVQSENDYYR